MERVSRRLAARGAADGARPKELADSFTASDDDKSFASLSMSTAPKPWHIDDGGRGHPPISIFSNASLALAVWYMCPQAPKRRVLQMDRSTPHQCVLCLHPVREHSSDASLIRQPHVARTWPHPRRQ